MMAFSSPLQTHWQGALWKVLACAFFACTNSVVRYVSGGAGGLENPLSSYEITFLQNAFACLFFAPYILKGSLERLKTSYLSLHMLRVLTAVLGVIFWYLSLASSITVAEAVALGFTGPLFTILGAKLYLHERIGPYRGLGILIGFIGAFIIMRPDQILFGKDLAETYGWATLFPLLSAASIAICKLFSRKLSRYRESPEKLTIYLIFFMVPASAFFLPGHWTWPSGEQWSYCFLLGFLAAGAHYSTAKAYSLADVTFLTPFGFSRLILSALFAYLLFSEMPKSSGLWVGACIMMIATWLLALEDKRQRRLMTLEAKATAV